MSLNSGNTRRMLALVLLALVAGTAVAGAGAARRGAALNGLVRGTIRDASSGKPLAKACAIAYDVNANVGATSQVTGVNGTYSLSLPPGAYELQFYDCGPGTHAPQLYSGEDGLNDAAADPLTVTAGQTQTGIDASLRPGATVNVHTQTKAGVPIPNVLVCPLFGNDWAQNGYCYFTNAAGNASMAGILPGQTRIEAIYSLSNYYELLYYPQTRAIWQGAKILLTAGATVGPLTFAFNGPSAAAPVQRPRPIGAWAIVKNRVTYVR